ncbi:MAG: pyridoxamine 5'-phosphate oxidase family protein [Gammaproteobacteria bacterium]|nr:pyridoxamine 5'-phosphate oxidase family protein [Gammaproteobacteria bacterium]
MAKLEGNCREVCEATEFVTIITQGDDGPHVVGNWGDYMRKLGIREDTLVFPAGRYLQTERNLRSNGRIQLLIASRKVQGTRTPGQGYLLEGRGEIVESGDTVAVVKAQFPWARGALVIHVEKVTAQL